MKVIKIPFLAIVTLLLVISQSASAQPTFQVYSPDYVFAGDYYQDQDTWFVNTNPAELWVIGAYHNETTELTNVTLVLSVPDGETGSITITGAAGTGTDDPSFLGRYSDMSFIPSGVKFNNHYPFKRNVSDFLVYDIDPFENVGDRVWDYNADDGGSATPTNTYGQVKEYTVAITGFTSVHFDAFGLEGVGIDHKWKTSWEMAPGSHDVTWIPAPGAIFLGSIGVGIVGWLRRKKAL